MRTQGKIVREPNQGPGLVMIQGQQFRFLQEKWASHIVPKPGLAVEVELDRNLEIVSVRATPELQTGCEHTRDPCARQVGLNKGGNAFRRIYAMLVGRAVGRKARHENENNENKEK